jgi:hypothetical protein
MHYVIRHDLRNIMIGGRAYFVTELFRKLIDALRARHPGHTFEVRADAAYASMGYGGLHSCLHLSVLNPSSQRYALVSLLDNWRDHFRRSLGWEADRMAQFFYPGGFDFAEYFAFKRAERTNSDIAFPERIEDTYRGIPYYPYFAGCEGEMEHLFLWPRSPATRLVFRGWLWEHRAEMVAGLGGDEVVVIDTNAGGERLLYSDYLAELSDATAVLSLPGGAPLCNRDIEAFAVGTPVLRPYVPCNHTDPLLPGVHYICCYHQPDFGVDGRARFASNQDFQANLLKTWDRVKDDREYLTFIARNARAWYARNCPMDLQVERLSRELNLEALS